MTNIKILHFSTKDAWALKERRRQSTVEDFHDQPSSKEGRAENVYYKEKKKRTNWLKFQSK